jgi:hypothetical protein
MQRRVIIIVMALTVCLALAAEKESADMRPAVGGGFSIPTFDRSGLDYIVRGNIAVLPFLFITPEIGYGHWNLQSGGFEYLTSDESDRQSWEHHQDLKSRYVMLGLRGYPLTRWTSRLSPYLLASGGLDFFSYHDQFLFWGTYSYQSDWTKKALASNSGTLVMLTGGIGLDMPLDKIWSLNYEYRWTYLSGTIGEEFNIATDGVGMAGTIGKQDVKNYLLQYPITIVVEVRPW